MTNVPQDIRDLWKEMYCLFDRNYLMPNIKEAWDKYWAEVEEIRKKYSSYSFLFSMIDLVTLMIETRMLENMNKDDGTPDIQKQMGMF